MGDAIDLPKNPASSGISPISLKRVEMPNPNARKREGDDKGSNSPFLGSSMEQKLREKGLQRSLRDFWIRGTCTAVKANTRGFHRRLGSFPWASQGLLS